MKYKLFAPVNKNWSGLEQFLVNRGIAIQDVPHYINTTRADVNDPTAFGEDKMYGAAATLATSIKQQAKTMIIVDSDCDGLTSAAIIYNYLYNFVPTFVQNNVDFWMHDGKQHGLKDCVDYLIDNNYDLVIAPDSSTNDVEECYKLNQNYCKVIILDHHEKEVDNPYADIINSQLNGYPNKELSGAGVTWQFCRYLDKILGIDYSQNLLDLVMVGLTGDMMSLKSFETKELIREGLVSVINPFISAMFAKNSYSLGANPTSYGVAFYIVPYINAICRSGELEEKRLVFKSMLTRFAYEQILSTKRGHKLNETESLVTQAVRVASNVKTRQSKAQDEGMKLLEDMITDQGIINNKAMIFTIEPNVLDRNIAGLAANKIMGKYQRPVCVLTKTENGYEGSARGCERSGLSDFKALCQSTGLINYAQGHANAFGLSVPAENMEMFKDAIEDNIHNSQCDQLCYWVDYIFSGNDIDPRIITNLNNCSDYYGKDIEQSLVAVDGLVVTKDMISLMGKETKSTMKISLPNGMNIIKFGVTEEEVEALTAHSDYSKIIMNIVGKCNVNIWGDTATPQIIIVDYDYTVQAGRKWVF